MRKIFRGVLAAALGLVVALGTVFVASSPAQAANWSNISVKVAADRYTSQCPCYYWDSIDGTYFKKDNGGRAVKLHVYYGGSLIGKIEFHPYGEHIWVYSRTVKTTYGGYSLKAIKPFSYGKKTLGTGSRSVSGYRYADHNLSYREGAKVGLEAKVYYQTQWGTSSKSFYGKTAVA